MFTLKLSSGWRMLIPPLVLLLTTLILAALCGVAWAQEAGTADPGPAQSLVFPTDQVWGFVAAQFITLPTYLLNHYAPYVSEVAKGLVLVATTAVASGITQAITMGEVGLNATTLQYVGLSVLYAFIAHKFVWQTTGIAQELGAGTNKQGQPPA